jgi:hypothetical protein
MKLFSFTAGFNRVLRFAVNSLAVSTVSFANKERKPLKRLGPSL